MQLVGGPPPNAPTLDPILFVLVVAGIGSALVVALALAAFARRQSLSYFLVTVALATLLLRSLLGVLFVNGYLASPYHHFMEHGLDVLVVVLLFAAVYAARTVDPGRPSDG